MIKNYFVEFSSSLSKDEKVILLFFIEKYLKNTTLDFVMEDLNIPKLKGSKKIFLERLGKKGIYFIDIDKNKIYCPFFNMIIFSQDNVSLFFNLNFIEYLTDKDKKLSYSLKEILCLKYNFSIQFFYKILKKNIFKEIFKINIIKFKMLLEIDTYDRIYDLKRFILEPLVEDISKNTDFKIQFLLKKEELNWIIIFNIKNKKIERIKNYSDNFFKLYKSHIKNKNKIEQLFYNSLSIYGYDFVKNKILFSIKNKILYNLDFDEILEKVFNNNIGESYIILKNANEKVESINLFRKLIHKQLKTLDFPEISLYEYNTALERKLFSIKENEMISIDSENLKVELTYSPKSISKVIIYKKYLKNI